MMSKTRPKDKFGRTTAIALPLVVILLAALLALPLACGKKEAGEIKIGAVLCLTGSGAPYGEDALRGIQVAVDEIMESGGINGKELQLIVEDDQTAPSVSASATSKLINQDKVQVIIGAVTSSSMLADAPIANKAGVVMISPGASNPSISNAGDFIFRNWISDELEGRAMADYLYHDEGVRSVAIFYINNDYGAGLRDVFERRFKELGGIIVAIESCNQDDVDFRTQLVKIKESKPERIYLPGYYKEMALILKQARELGIDIAFRSVVTFEEPELLRLAPLEAEGVIYSSPYYNPETTEEHVQQFVERFRQRFERDPGIFAGHGYDGMMIVASVLRRLPQISSHGIRDGLYELKGFPGVTGLTSFDKNGDVNKPIAIKQVQGGKFVLLKQIHLE